MMKNILWNCSIAVFGGILLALSYINPYENSIPLSRLILQLSGSRADLMLGRSFPELLGLSIRMIPVFISSIVIGIELFRHFCTASVYIFSRNTKRLRWFCSEILFMLLLSILFNTFLVLSAIGVTCIRYVVLFDAPGMILCIYHILIYSMWLFITALLLAVVAIYIGSDMSYIIIVGSQVFMIGLLGIANISNNSQYISLNPAAHLVLGWHSSYIESISEVIGNVCTNLSFGLSFSALLVSSLVITVITGYLILHYDILTINAEIGGN